MRSLMAARLVLLDSDLVRREVLVRTLTELGAFEIAGIATVAEIASVPAPDLFLIESQSLAANDAGGNLPPNPFAASGIPTVLLLPEPTNEQRRAAIRAGFSIVLAAPVPHRLLYRRIAQLLQNARRAKRRMEAGNSGRDKALEQAAPQPDALLA